MSNEKITIKLIVDDVGAVQIGKNQSGRRGVAYLSSKLMSNHSISVGDIIIVSNDIDDNDNNRDNKYINKSIAIAWPVKKMTLNHIQLDNIQRDNCNVGVGGFVTIEKTSLLSIPLNNNNNNKNTINNDKDGGIIVLPAFNVQVECLTSSMNEYVDKLTQHGLLGSLLSSQLSSYHFIKGNRFICLLNGRQTKFKIIDLISTSNHNNNQDNQPNNNQDNNLIIYKIKENTIFKLQQLSKDDERIKEKNELKDKDKEESIGYQSIGGLNNQVEQVKELIELAFSKGDVLERFGVKPPRGILLYGMPGTGKTLLARIVAKETGCSLFTLNGADVLDKYYGATEKTIQGVFRDAAARAPSIVFIDELDALCPKRDEAASEIEKRVVGCLLTLLDGISSNARILVLGCTNRPDALDSALRRPGRFDREIEIGIPNADARHQILSIFLNRIPHSLTPDQILSISQRTHGFVGADLESLIKESAMKRFHRIVNNNNNDTLMDIKIEIQDVLNALGEVRPSSMREVVVEIPHVKWDDIGGQKDTKDKLREAIEWPLKHPQAFARMGIRPPKGILLYGPPGCSKTLLAKALATESGLNFIAVKGPELLSKWVGESERAVRDIFKKARQNSPSILFFDEIDGLAVSRSGEGSGAVERVVSQLLTEMDGIQPLTNVTIIAATNRPDIIDKAILRAGRIDRILYIAPPDYEARKEIFKIHLQKVPHHNDIDIDQLSQLSDGYSGAEVTSICKEASIHAMKEDINAEKVKMSHFISSLATVKKGITREMIAFYDNYQQQSNLQKL